jgi:hypothetical protein
MDRLQEIKNKQKWLYLGDSCGVNEDDVECLISEVELLRIYKKSASKEIERLQEENERKEIKYKNFVNSSYEAVKILEQKAERLEKVLNEILEVADGERYSEKVIQIEVIADKALETEGKG